MRALPDVDLVMTGPGQGHLYVDGAEVHVTNVSVRAGVGQPNLLTAEMPIGKVTVRGAMQTVITNCSAPSYFDYNARRRA